MKVIHIDANNKGGASMLKDEYKNGNHIFMLIRRDGCPPCESTKPEWLKIEHSSQIKPKNGIIVDIEEQTLNEIGYMKPAVNIVGFPTMVCIKNKKIKSYDDSMTNKRDELNGKSRTVDSFVDWIVEEYEKQPIKTRKMRGGKRRKSKRTKRKRRQSKKSRR
jgi:hypothetical protein